ncbi:DUF488 family protein [Halobacterium salinarum]|nr:DUF488 family protein [Halobacterium salinarum]MCF2168254.1 DUF488 family protein [Halobacterium salinarum]
MGVVTLTEARENGMLRDTYLAALQHDHVEPDSEALVLGVVRKPMHGFSSVVDENRPALAPPTDLLDEVKEVADDVGHNEACRELRFEDRYLDHLETPAAQNAMHDLLDVLQERDVWLVCYENTEQKICHRTTLKDELQSQR